MIKAIKLGFNLLLITMAAGILLSVTVTLPLRWIAPPTSAFMIRNRLEAVRKKTKNYKLSYQWVSWDQISPQVRIAVVSSEDQKFQEHDGFDLESIQDAVDDHLRGRRLRGASTISQQVAKNLYLWPGKSFIRKGLEAYFTFLLESFLPKKRILEIYLNIAQFGPSVFGVGAAGHLYFKKPAGKINSEEAALLAAVLPNPVRLHADRPSAYVRDRQAWILSQMAMLGGSDYLRNIDRY